MNTKERLEQIGTRLAEIEAEKQKTPFYAQTNLLKEESVLKAELRAEYFRLKKAKRDVQIKESKPGLSEAEVRACSAEFMAIQQEQIDLITKHPELKDAETDKIREAEQKAHTDKINKQPPEV